MCLVLKRDRLFVKVADVMVRNGGKVTLDVYVETARLKIKKLNL